ncbi:DEAD/DEAH box helicase family protein [Thalassospira sp. MA62]|nr:DEAD/DEAH box helicase family protein [Thalassospira sp. MA62]
MDFSKLGSTTKTALPTDPIKIFETLPSLSGTFNDLWRGQDQALTNWNENRTKNDVLVSLNTGAGKTIVGLLIAQSLVNEGLENVLYVCSTIDLVNQTYNEATRIGMEPTIRVRKAFSNDMFETGKSFCITTYAALFNGHSALRHKHFPGAVIFDDAHVAESLLRTAFTLRLDTHNNKDIFDEISELFRPYFKDLGIHGRFNDSLDPSHHVTAFVAPSGLYERSEQLLAILKKHGIKDHESLTYSFAWLEDHLDACAAIFSRGAFELSPPFLPSLALDIFQQNLRRVYLSATLESQTDFVRAFGRLPDHTATPSNDAGNGERLIIDGQHIEGGFSPAFISDLVSETKAVIAVPDYNHAEEWENVASPPTTENFSEELNKFREQKTGGFVLVSRVDGIDLPHDICRIMVLAGLPSGTSLLERYQWEFLRMNNVHAVRVANRLAQLFGRINRGRNDYGAFLVQSPELSKWLGNDRNLALLPPLLQRQILIGREVQHSFKITSQNEAKALTERVLGRDTGWLEYYQREVKLAKLDEDQLARHNSAEPFMVQAALSEAKYAAAMWHHDPSTARRELEKSVDNTAKHDTPLGGWHAVWLGAAYTLEGDNDAAFISYGNAMKRLGGGITLPRPINGRVTKATGPELNAFGCSVRDIVSFTHGGKYEQECAKLRTALLDIEKGTSKQAEAAVRLLGELLGFTSTRPDNDQGTGPDVLWIDQELQVQVGFELKTDKTPPAKYSKTQDVAQVHDHLSFMHEHHPEYRILGVALLGPDGTVESNANPSDLMYHCSTDRIIALREELFALFEDLRKQTPMERLIVLDKISREYHWQTNGILERLSFSPLKNLIS